MGPRDQRAIEARPDVLVYSGPVLERDLEIVGPVDVVLYAASTAQDTDFAVKLVDVHPDGRAINLVDGILRASHREGGTAPSPIEPDRVYRYAFRVGHTAALFRAGHRVRVEIAGTNFPQYERTLNVFRTDRHGGWRDARTATTRLFHDAERPSHIVLPVVHG
jgi:putative CocE/NonD family hydrolase